jgi:hypothetical protein
MGWPGKKSYVTPTQRGKKKRSTEITPISVADDGGGGGRERALTGLVKHA